LRKIKVFAGLLVFALVLSGCSGTETRPVIRPSASFPAEFAKYYEQELETSDCGENLVCADIEVPMDWSNPDSEAIQIATVYRKADKQAKGFVAFNPGGPGASGFDWVNDSGDFLGTKTLRESFNIIGFDPRGVGRSSSVTCLTDSEYDEFLYGVSGFELGSEADLASARESLADFASKCQEKTGDLLGFVDTVSAAKDMDVIRAVFGQDKLNFLGYSYGSFLGTTYATLFPENVGRFVLDGAIDPTVADQEQTRYQIEAFENALRAFLENCSQFEDCPFTGSVEANLTRIQQFLFSLESKPLSTSSNRELTIWAAVTGLIMTLYSESYWPTLSTAFDEAFSGRGDTFLSLADFYNDRGDDGKYLTNLIPANYAINCLDSRSDSSMSAMLEENQRLIEIAPTLGRYWQFGALSCENWPYPPSDRPADYSATGAPTILVIGTTGDPATPYSQAVALANDVLADGFLITYNGEGHTIYGQQVSCVDDAVDSFFLTGDLPAKDPSC
jgi:pimeloyl-ACP methyl ester carboxylesterase